MIKSEARVSVPIGIDQHLSETASAGYVGRIVDVTPGRDPAERDQRDLIIPIGRNQFKTVELRPGEYIIEAVAPSGELLDRHVSVRHGRGRPKPVRLGHLRELADDLGWQVASGNIDRALWAAEKGVRDAELVIAEAKRSWRLLPLAMIIAAIVAITIALTLYLFFGRPVESIVAAASGWRLWLIVPAGLLVFLSLVYVRTRAGRRAEAPGEAAAASAEIAAATTAGSAPGASAGAPAAASASPGAEASAAGSEQPASAAMLFRVPAGAAAWELVSAAGSGLAAVETIIGAIETAAAVEPRESEGFRFFNISPDHPLARPGLGGRLFALVPAAGCTGEIVSIPLPWDCGDGHRAEFEIAASSNASSSFSSASTVKDANTATILGYMSAGRLSQAEMLVRDAQELLNHKHSNAWAAAVGAYVLIASCTAKEGDQSWRQWIGNLHAHFPDLADGAILQGWNLFQQQTDPASLDAARDCFLEAVDRGIPVYSEGVRLLQSGLAMFGRHKEDNPRLADAIAKADALAIRCSPTQAFTTLRIDPGP